MSESVTLTVTGMKCGGCESNITTKLQALEGVLSVSASHKEDEVEIEFDPAKTDQDSIVDAITEAGFVVED
ncbi:MAG: heavy-metal-associated domain-containing protein [Gammaproteobacteria bacterium]